MDRQIVYPGSIPLDTDLLLLQRATMVALGALAQATLGPNPVVDGLACTPTVPPSLSVSVGPGSISQLAPIDALPFGSLPATGVQPIMKTGINTAPTLFTLVPPSIAGNAVAYLVQASLNEADATPVVLPYYNAANPAQPFTGPDNAGTAQNTQRIQRVGLQCKPGAAAPAGTQTPPAADPGWIGLAVITLGYGQTQLNPPDIAPVPAAPLIPFKLPQLTPGFSRQVVLGPGAASWAVPPGVTAIRAQAIGGGGGGGGGSSAFSGGGGGAGGYAQGIFVVQPGAAISLGIGSGGSGAAPGNTGGVGGNTSLGTLLTAFGGSGGGSANPDSQGGLGGNASGGQINQPGGNGGDGFPAISSAAGNGGASFFGGGGRGSANGGPPAAARAAGAGGGGGYSVPCTGGSGAPGLAIIEF